MALCGLLVLASWLKVWKGAVPFDPAILAALIGGVPYMIGAAKAILRRGDTTVGFLVSLATVGALAIGEYFAAGEVVFIMLLGEWMEERTLDKTRESIHKLVALAPQVARIRRDGAEVAIPVREVRVGDVVLVKSGERIPVDGVCLGGRASVNQAAITGESIPVERATGHEVFTGTLVEAGFLELEATKIGGDTTLAKVIKLVQEAQESKAPIQRVTDRFAQWFSPVVVVIAVLTYLVTRDAVRAVTVLVVACPCAMVIATPTAVVAAVGNAARQGILIKGGKALERAGAVNLVAFDKTGTLTAGRPEVVRVLSYGGTGEAEVLARAATAELRSEHPLGVAIVRQAEKSGPVAPPDDFEVTIGEGVKAHVSDATILVGSRRLMSAAGLAIPAAVETDLVGLEEAGLTAMLVAWGGAVRGLVAVADVVRPEAAQAIRDLWQIGVQRTVMLTGDNPRTAKAIAAATGVSEFLASQMPEDKAGSVARLKGQGYLVAMVGDGVNDAPALASADLGIAMGVAGTDVAIETADIALMADDVTKVARAIALGRRAVHVIKQNLWLSGLINATAVLVSVMGVLTPVAGAIVHNVGSTLVVVNSARLLRPTALKVGVAGRSNRAGAARQASWSQSTLK
jgi:heavy metal translocating P-type ATPase